MSQPEHQHWVTLAVLHKPRGNRGELAAEGFSKPERYQGLRQVFLFTPGTEGGVPYDVESVWFHGDRLIFKFVGVNSISAADQLRGAEVRVPFEERAEAGPGEVYRSDVIGCDVVERDGSTKVGSVKGWLDTSGTPLLELDNGMLIPFAASICVRIDLEKRRIVVDLPDGLKDLNRA